MKPLQSFVNRIIHADCLTVLPELPEACVDLIVTDPPYLVNYVPRDGRRCHNDDDPSWLGPAFKELYRILKPDCHLATFYGWPWVDLFMAAWKGAGFRPVSHLVWIKAHCSREGYTRSFHETGFLLAKGKPSKPANPLPDFLPWKYTGNKHHTNEKPVIAIQPIIETYSRPGDIVLDPFAGSGTTGLAARACQRNFILIEKVRWHTETARRRIFH